MPLNSFSLVSVLASFALLGCDGNPSTIFDDDAGSDDGSAAADRSASPDAIGQPDSASLVDASVADTSPPGDASVVIACGSPSLTCDITGGEVCCRTGNGPYSYACTTASGCTGATISCDAPTDCKTAGEGCCQYVSTSIYFGCVPVKMCNPIDHLLCNSLADCPGYATKCTGRCN